MSDVEAVLAHCGTGSEGHLEETKAIFSRCLTTRDDAEWQRLHERVSRVLAWYEHRRGRAAADGLPSAIRLRAFLEENADLAAAERKSA